MIFKNIYEMVARGKDGGGGGYSPPAAPDPALDSYARDALKKARR